ncbi:solute carrier family 16, member [Geosmithia morbida]|uniref:Solute carrier family 16, member n=1 Tax=Geosmithia morbida TaxID=1094350 RepID=A0A9P4YM81_9HYPO|nr:solute carrier family 16, member [Geosmithia morbida]KAF4119558.1 solute carrier family 16, member [Geosmithia morbida]
MTAAVDITPSGSSDNPTNHGGERDGHHQPPAPIDGGTRAWLHAFLCHMVFFNTWGITNSYGVFQQYYTHTLGVGPSSIAWVGGLQMFLLLGGGVLSGRASDAGYFRHCLFAGAFLQVIGFVLLSFADRYYQVLLSQGVCVGLGHGLLFTPSLSVTSSYFKANRALALGISAAGASTGGMVYPAVVSQLLGNPAVGYGWAMRAVALIVLCTHIPSLVGFRSHLPKRTGRQLIDWQAFREGPFVCFTIGFFLHFWGLYMAFFYLGIYARQTLHVEDTLSLITIINGVGVAGRVVPNMISQRTIGTLNMAILFSVACSACVYCWAAIRSTAGLYAWVVVYGISSGAMQSLMPTLATSQAHEPDKVGTWTGMVLTIVSFATLTGPSIQGALIQGDGGRYLWAEVFSASSIVLGCMFLVASRCYSVGPVFAAKI